MKKAIIFLLFNLPITPTIAQWTYVNPLPFSYDIYSSFFISDSVGWVVGQDGTINKTLNAGKTWVPEESNLPPTHHLKSVYFFNDRIGWAVAWEGHILKTTDGGGSWIAQSSGTTMWLLSVNFVTPDTGYVLGIQGTILKTTNGGSDWQQLPSTLADIYSSQFISKNIGYAVGCSNPPWTYRTMDVILKTTDGGLTWDTKYVDSVGLSFNSCFFTDSLKGWVVGDKGKVYRTTDAGSHWTKANVDSTKTFNAISFKNELVGCVVCGNDSSTYRTTDGGDNWERIPLNSFCSLTNIFFTEAKVYVSGMRGIIFYSDDEGKTWQSLNKNVTSNGLYSASFVDKSKGWAVGWGGTIIKTSDGGNNWFEQQSHTESSLNSVVFLIH